MFITFNLGRFRLKRCIITSKSWLTNNGFILLGFLMYKPRNKYKLCIFKSTYILAIHTSCNHVYKTFYKTYNTYIILWTYVNHAYEQTEKYKWPSNTHTPSTNCVVFQGKSTDNTLRVRWHSRTAGQRATMEAISFVITKAVELS